VFDTVELSSRMRCTLTLTRAGSAMEKALRVWGFVPAPDGLEWHGSLPGPDRLRFVGMLSRYTALLARVHMQAEAVSATASAEPAVGPVPDARRAP